MLCKENGLHSGSDYYFFTITPEAEKLLYYITSVGEFCADYGYRVEREDYHNYMVNQLRIKTPSINEIVGQLSGGNQQKVVIGKWINADADVYIFDEPTRGIDVGAKIEVYNVMNSLVKQGKCVIMKNLLCVFLIGF